MIPLLALLAAPPSPPLWFVCDAIDRPVAYLVAQPAGGRVRITTVEKPSGRTSARTYLIGRGEPGMGQIFYDLGRGGREGNLHLVNAGMVGSSATTPVATGVTLAGRATECRWLANTALNGVTGRRGVTITRESGRLVYRTYDFARPGRVVRPDGVQRTTVPSLEVRGGTEKRTPGGRRFRFANADWTYVASVEPQTATLTVQRAGRTVQVERFVGVTIAP